MQSSHFVSSLPGMWVFGLALELLLLLLAQLTPPPPESITQKKSRGMETTKALRPYHLFFFVCLSWRCSSFSHHCGSGCFAIAIFKDMLEADLYGGLSTCGIY